MRRLIQELKVGGSYVGTPGRLPGHVAEFWVPTKNARAMERLAKEESWWVYGDRSGTMEYDKIPKSGRSKRFTKSGSQEGRVYYVRIESPASERRFKGLVASVGGVYMGKVNVAPKAMPWRRAA